MNTPSQENRRPDRRATGGWRARRQDLGRSGGYESKSEKRKFQNLNLRLGTLVGHLTHGITLPHAPTHTHHTPNLESHSPRMTDTASGGALRGKTV